MPVVNLGAGKSVAGTKAQEKRVALRDSLFPGEIPWAKGKEIGYFSASRTLPLLLQLLKKLPGNGNQDPGPVYLELLSRHMGDGFIQLTHEEDHAHAAGYTAVRAWRERMKLLEAAGFIRAKKNGTRYAWVLLVHPAIAVERLRKANKVKAAWYDSYVARKAETKESAPPTDTV